MTGGDRAIIGDLCLNNLIRGMITIFLNKNSYQLVPVSCISFDN